MSPFFFSQRLIERSHIGISSPYKHDDVMTVEKDLGTMGVKRTPLKPEFGVPTNNDRPTREESQICVITLSPHTGRTGGIIDDSDCDNPSALPSGAPREDCTSAPPSGRLGAIDNDDNTNHPPSSKPRMRTESVARNSVEEIRMSNGNAEISVGRPIHSQSDIVKKRTTTSDEVDCDKCETARN